MDVSESRGPRQRRRTRGRHRRGRRVHTVSGCRLSTGWVLRSALSHGALTVSFEWDRVRYSSIDREPRRRPCSMPIKIRARMTAMNFVSGGEYVFHAPRTKCSRSRFGVWRDPAHGLGSGPDADAVRARCLRWRPSPSFTSPAVRGVVFRHVQLDFGFDLSDTTDLVVAFGRLPVLTSSNPLHRLVVVVALVIASRWGLPQSAQTWFESYHEAEEALADENWTEAIGHLNDALRKETRLERHGLVPTVCASSSTFRS